MKRPPSKPVRAQAKVGTAKTPSDWLRLITQTILTLLFIGVPFHAFIVIILGYRFGHQLEFAAWKETLILLLVFASVAQIWLTKDRTFWRRRANWALFVTLIMAAFASLLAGRFDTVWLVGVKTTVMPLLLFLAVQPWADNFTDRRLTMLIVVPALIVAAFALWQFLFIPTNWLASLGYSASTILPYQSVHPGFDYGRAFSTLGGPNQLGAYLILPTVWLFALAIKAKERTNRMWAAVGFSLTFCALAVSFSRSALVGVLAGLAVLLLLLIPRRWRWPMVGGIVISTLIIWKVIASTIDNTSVSGLKSFLLRGELTTAGVVGGDSGHISAVQNGLGLVANNPIGLGLGIAGPASFYAAHPVLTENWWLQIALETGILGALGVVAAFCLMIRRWLLRKSLLDYVMVASLAGLAVTNLFLHSFADSTLAITFFGLAGIIYARQEQKQ